MNQIKLGLFVLILLGVHFTGMAQEKNVTHGNQQWLQYNTQTSLNTKFSLLVDSGFRWKNEFSEKSQYLARTAARFSPNTKVSFTTGFMNLGFFSNEKIDRLEFRPYQEFQLNGTLQQLKLEHRFGLEERFFRTKIGENKETSNSFNFRYRYRLLCTVPIYTFPGNHSKNITFSAGEELLINSGREIVYNVFDQSRILLVPTFQFSEKMAVSFTYMNQFGKFNSPNGFRDTNVFWVAVRQKIDLTKQG